jgi:hypothetical protein
MINRTLLVLLVQKLSIRYLTIAVLIILFSINNPVCCTAQQECSDSLVLLVKHMKMKDKQMDSLRTFFATGDRIKIVDYNGNVYMGPVTNLTDTTITIKTEKISIDKIKTICFLRGITNSILGSSIVPTSLSSILTIIGLQNLSVTNYDLNILYVVGVEVVIGFAGLIPTAVGIAQVASVKHYHIGKKWKLIVAPIKIARDKYMSRGWLRPPPDF